MSGIQLLLMRIKRLLTFKRVPLKIKIEELEKANHKLRYNNLMMRIYLETLAENINSGASKKILAKYRRLIAIRKERELESQN